MDFSTPGGLATLSYRDITAGQTAFTQDATIKGVNMGLTPDGNGKYTFDTLNMRGSVRWLRWL